MKTLVVAGGELNGLVATDLPEYDYLIAVDSGLDHASTLGLKVDRVVGDLDSVSTKALEKAEADGVPIDRYPPAKNETDLEIALDAALAIGTTRLSVAAIGGGRFDHAFGNLLLLTNERYATMRIGLYDGSSTGQVVREECTFTGEPGTLISLFPIGGHAHGVTTTGLRYPLANETLPANTGRGLSNEFVETEASIRLAAGVLLALQPRSQLATHK